jgi:Na+/H+ antiporter NhaC
MGGWIFFVGLILFLVVLIYFYIRYNNSSSRDNEANSSSTQSTDTELLSDLPGAFYGLAILCGVVLLIFTLVNADKFSSFQIGSLIGYTVGGALSMLAVGRVIELLQQIRDAVRNIPTLSPGRSDDE